MASSTTTPLNCPLVPIWENLTSLHQHSFPFLPPIDVTLGAIKNWLLAHYYNHHRIEAALQSLQFLHIHPLPSCLQQPHINPADILRLAWSLVILRPSVFPLFLEILLELSAETTALQQSSRLLQLAWLLSPLTQHNDPTTTNHHPSIRHQVNHRLHQQHSYIRPVPLMAISITSAKPPHFSSAEMANPQHGKQRSSHNQPPHIIKDNRYSPTTRIILPSSRHRANVRQRISRQDPMAGTASSFPPNRPNVQLEQSTSDSSAQSADIIPAFSTEDIDLS